MNMLDLRMQAENDAYTFLVGNLAENTKKRRMQSLRVSLRDDGGRVILLPEQLRTRDFCDDRGEFRYLLSIKMERNTLKEYSFQIPARLFEWIEPATRMTLRVERLEDDGSVSASGQLVLLADLGGKCIRYSVEKFVDCLLAGRDTSFLLTFLRTDLSDLGEEQVSRLTDHLAENAENDMSGHAAFELYELYQDSVFTGRDEKKAGEWLYQSAQKHYPEAMRALREAPVSYQPPKMEEFSSLEMCIASAEGGNRDAQYHLYTHYADENSADCDHALALEWLERAVESGHDEAAVQLEKTYLSSFLVEADTDHFLSLLEKGAANGSAAAHLMLFKSYYSGECLRRPVKKERRHALECLRSAASAGNVDACYRMWQHFENGNDLLVGEQDAVAMLERAADSGNADAMNDLGELYVTGRIVKKENEKGVNLIREAARLGCFGAQMRVYRMWADGRYYDVLLETDQAEAYRHLLSYAQESENPMAQTLLWEMYTDKNPVMLTRFEALDYLRRAANHEYLPAMFQMANIELTGVYKDVNTEEGFRLLTRAAKLGDADSQLALFELYATGSYFALTSPVNRERAFKWIARSAVSHPQALYEMWMLYCNGNEMELEPGDAIDMLFSSAGMQCQDALYAVALLFARGERVPLDLARAVKYLKSAADLNHAKSMFQLYQVYSSGKFEAQILEKDQVLATRMLLLSAQSGYAPACAEVCRLFEEAGNPIGVDKTFTAECRTFLTNAAPADERPITPPSSDESKRPEKAEAKKTESQAAPSKEQDA